MNKMIMMSGYIGICRRGTMAGLFSAFFLTTAAAFYPADPLQISVTPDVQNPPAGKYPLRWIYGSMNFQTDAGIDSKITTMEEAARLGYNGFLITDYKFGSFSNRPAQFYKNIERFAKRAKELNIEIIPTVMTTSLMINDPSMVEGLPVRNQEFIVKDGKAVIKNTDNLLLNGGFEEMKKNNSDFADFNWIDAPGTSSYRDQEIKHTGKASVRLEDFRAGNSHGNARINRKLTLKPWHQYKASVWIKTKDLVPCEAENPRLAILCADGRGLVHRNMNTKATQDWTQYTVTFNSLEFSEANLYCGLWAGTSGKFWVDDMEIAECGAVNMIRRDGCPIKVTSADGATAYEEGKDFLPWTDPKSGHSPWAGSWDDWHDASPIVLTSGSRINNGDTLTVSYYHVVQILWGATFPCYLNKDLFRYGREQVEALEKYFKPRKYFLAHDEIRLCGWCGTCAPHGTCGEILAEHMRRCTAMIRGVNPTADLFVWNDMFDPFHNAKVHPYYLAATSFDGSWKGLDSSIIIANWYAGKRAENTVFFQDLGMRQIIAGYYDSGADRVKPNLNTWLDAADKVRGVQGVIYTTWNDNYKHMDLFIDALKERTGEKK